MTDRHAGYLVTLMKDIRDDDAEAVISALRMVRFVVGVQPIPADSATAIAEERRDAQWRDAVAKLHREGPAAVD